ncbi:tetratricopeptide repeat protein [Prevotella sp. tf2-5]|uniref:type IX secretion system periplasmic lipoprotein PorW/SprE n=1 Tax=Prevotella sp. tf2-5 TaxID=1761889 RepID=UPI0008E3C1C8|nr:tetratricopeptide repeat protein [Prevotella sp. tf2-5]SFO61627.1 Tetratricopeptide repeat-containing protein [Prevotella sp. tf2-5]
MTFALIIIGSIIALGVIAALLSWGDKDEPVVKSEGDCSSCSSRAECKLADLVKKGERKEEKGECNESRHSVLGVILVFSLLLPLSSFLMTSCSTKKNTASTRWWHSFNARYNTYFNGSQAFIEGSLEKENGNKDDHTQLIPLYTVANKNSKALGSGQFDRAIEKSEKAIRRHTIKARPVWKKSRRKTQKDIEWLNRREYNPFLWRAWLLLGKSQFQKGEFEEASATFGYMARLYQTQPVILARARAWQAKCYAEMDWLYEAEDLITKQRRDSIPSRAAADWDYTLADYHIRSEHWPEAVTFLRKAIKHERRRKQRARMWFLMGQIESLQGHRQEAYDAYRHVIRLSPPYELEFNARIAQSEVMAATDAKNTIKKLRRMAASDNNKDYLDQVYYAIGNVYLAQHDTLQAIAAYEKGNKEATRSGTEKGVLLWQLGNLYWQQEKYSDARRCYGEAIGLLDQDRPGYKELAQRSKVLDELVPYTDAIHLQDSLQVLANMPEAERNKAIDRVIEALIKKEKEEKRRQQEMEAEQQQIQNGGDNMPQPQTTNRPVTPTTPQSNLWYFYNPQVVGQGKQRFEQQWGKRPNADNWQRSNLTVLKLDAGDTENPEVPDSLENVESPEISDSLATTPDSISSDPHTREYYLAQIPFTEEQKAASDAIIMESLLKAGIILKDKLDNLTLSHKMLYRLVNQYPDYEHNDEAWYHLYLIYARQGRWAEADMALEQMKQRHAESQWTILLSDPYYAENQRFGQHIEDSLYAATYNAFREERYKEVETNVRLSAERFPNGENRAKFLFIEGLSLLNNNHADSCVARMRQIVEQYPQSEVSEMAGQIVKGVQQGRRLQGNRMTAADIWRQRQNLENPNDTSAIDTLSTQRDTRYTFILAYSPDSVNQNQLLYDIAKYNFTSYLVRNFDINIDTDGPISRMMVSGFRSYDEALQYAHQLFANLQMKQRLAGCRQIIISDQNLPLLGTVFSYDDYDIFFHEELAPVEVTKQQLLLQPDTIVEEPDEEDAPPQQQQNDDDDLFNSDAPPQNVEPVDFPDDFFR